MPRDLAYYRGLPYQRRCRLEIEDGEFYWHAWIEELPGCEVDAESKAAAFANLDEVFEDYVAAKLEWGSRIPEPTRWPRLVESRAATMPRLNQISVHEASDSGDDPQRVSESDRTETFAPV